MIGNNPVPNPGNPGPLKWCSMKIVQPVQECINTLHVSSWHDKFGDADLAAQHVLAAQWTDKYLLEAIQASGILWYKQWLVRSASLLWGRLCLLGSWLSMQALHPTSHVKPHAYIRAKIWLVEATTMPAVSSGHFQSFRQA